MDAVFIDQNGNKKNFLYQYDIGQTFVIENFEYTKAPKVQFSIKSIKTMPSVRSQLIDGNLNVSIPDMLLTYGENIVVYLYIENGQKGSTVETIFISVIPRKRPADYIYTDEMFARTINGTTVSEKSGFSEVGEWEDKNVGDEDRCYHFVSVTYDIYGDRLIVKKATSLDDVYGVAVHEVGFASNCTEDKLNDSGILLPKYAHVCTSGFAKVIDNGRCTIGGMCVPDIDGTATIPTNTVGYKVVDRIDEDHILIFVDPSMQTINNFQTNIVDTSDSLMSHTNNKSNPHYVTKEQVGLGNADNTSDINKPVSNAQASAISKAKTEVQNNLNQHVNNIDNPHSVTAHQVGAYTQEETDAKIASLVDSAPETLDTLNELAAALGDDPNFATTVATEIGKKATKEEFDTHSNSVDNPHLVTKDQVGLGNVDNTSDIDKPVSTAQSSAISYAKAEVQNNIDEHTKDTNNPHNVTKLQIGLGNVDNTSDADKPISTAQSEEFKRIESLIDGTQSNVDSHSTKVDNPHSVTKSQIGLGNVDNTSDNDKPISVAQSNEFERIESLINVTQSNVDSHKSKVDNPHNVTKEQVGLGSCDNTSDADKPISTATQEALNSKADIVDGIVPLSQLPANLSPTVHADTHKMGGSDAITPSDIGAVSQSDFDELSKQVEDIAAFVNSIGNADIKQY